MHGGMKQELSYHKHIAQYDEGIYKHKLSHRDLEI